MGIKLTADCWICGKFRQLDIEDHLCAQCRQDPVAARRRVQRDTLILFVTILVILAALGLARMIYVIFVL